MSLQAADRYARAIFELGVEGGLSTPLGDSLARFSEAYASAPALRSALSNPMVADSERRAVLDAVAQRLDLHPLAQRTLKLLLKRRRLPVLGAIVKRLGQLEDERRGVARVRVSTAAPLSAGYLQRLQERLEQELRRRIEIEHQLDPELLAGVVVQVGDNTYDGSLAGRLHQLERRLLAPN